MKDKLSMLKKIKYSAIQSNIYHFRKTQKIDAIFSSCEKFQIVHGRSLLALSSVKPVNQIDNSQRCSFLALRSISSLQGNFFILVYFIPKKRDDIYSKILDLNNVKFRDIRGLFLAANVSIYRKVRKIQKQTKTRQKF